MSRVLLVSLLVLLFLICGTMATFGAVYTITELPTLGGPSSWAYGINSSGTVVGAADLGRLLTHGSVWSNGAVSDLGNVWYNTSDSYAFGINDSGTIAGWADSYADYRHPYIVKDGNMIQLGTMAGEAYAINNLGNSVGIASNPADHYNWDACIWKGTDTYFLDRMGADISLAYAINDSNFVAGTLGSQGNAVLWDDKGNPTLLGVLAKSNQLAWSEGLGINNLNQVVGYSDLDDMFEHAFLWENDSMIDLGTLPGGITSWASDINNLSQIVGYSISHPTVGEYIYSACLWENGQIMDLNSYLSSDSGWRLTQANAINDKGQIVGEGTYNGSWRGFLLTPVPEPSSILTLLCGLGGIGGIVLRKGRK